jgi:uncharacterized protein YqeY
MGDAAISMKARIRRDLTAAMKARRAAETRLLRVLLAALDNAEAVSIGAGHDRYTVRAFGDPSVETPRRVLSDADVQDLLVRERADRDIAAIEFDTLNRRDEADRMRNEAALIARYL